MRPERLALLVLVSTILVLIFGNEAERWLCAGALAVFAPWLWRAYRRHFWQQVEAIASSVEPPPEAPVSEPASNPPDMPAPLR